MLKPGQWNLYMFCAGETDGERVFRVYADDRTLAWSVTRLLQTVPQVGTNILPVTEQTKRELEVQFDGGSDFARLRLKRSRISLPDECHQWSRPCRVPVVRARWPFPPKRIQRRHVQELRFRGKQSRRWVLPLPDCAADELLEHRRERFISSAATGQHHHTRRTAHGISL